MEQEVHSVMGVRHALTITVVGNTYPLRGPTRYTIHDAQQQAAQLVPHHRPSPLEPKATTMSLIETEEGWQYILGSSIDLMRSAGISIEGAQEFGSELGLWAGKCGLVLDTGSRFHKCWIGSVCGVRVGGVLTGEPLVRGGWHSASLELSRGALHVY